MVWHPCHTHAAKFRELCEFCGRTAHPNHLCQSVPSVGEKIFPQNAHTEPSGREEPPTDEHGCSQIRRVWHPCHTHATQFCEFSAFRGRTAHHNNLCRSVPSVGERIFQQNARNTQNLLAEKSLPQMSTDFHRLGGYGIPAAIPTLSNSVYSVYSVGEQRTLSICVHPCHPWESFLCKKVLCVPCIPWEE